MATTVKKYSERLHNYGTLALMLSAVMGGVFGIVTLINMGAVLPMLLVAAPTAIAVGLLANIVYDLIKD